VHRGAVKADRKWRYEQIYSYLEGLYCIFSKKNFQKFSRNFRKDWSKFPEISRRKFPYSQPYTYLIIHLYFTFIQGLKLPCTTNPFHHTLFWYPAGVTYFRNLQPCINCLLFSVSFNCPFWPCAIDKSGYPSVLFNIHSALSYHIICQRVVCACIMQPNIISTLRQL